MGLFVVSHKAVDSFFINVKESLKKKCRGLFDEQPVKEKQGTNKSAYAEQNVKGAFEDVGLLVVLGGDDFVTVTHQIEKKGEQRLFVFPDPHIQIRTSKGCFNHFCVKIVFIDFVHETIEKKGVVDSPVGPESDRIAKYRVQIRVVDETPD